MGYSYFGCDIEALTHQMLEGLASFLRGSGMVTNRGLGVVVLDATKPWPSTEVLFQMTVDGPGDLALYLDVAMRKASAVLRTGVDTKSLAGPMRHLLQPGDHPAAGGILQNDLIVGVSGLNADQDHWIAEVIAGFVLLKRQEALDAWRQLHPNARFLQIDTQ